MATEATSCGFYDNRSETRHNVSTGLENAFWDFESIEVEVHQSMQIELMHLELMQIELMIQNPRVNGCRLRPYP